MGSSEWGGTSNGGGASSDECTGIAEAETAWVRCGYGYNVGTGVGRLLGGFDSRYSVGVWVQELR